jgi:carboxylate-amine ligase
VDSTRVVDRTEQEAPYIDQVLDFGVEEEFVLADRRDRASVPRAALVAADAADHLGERVQREFYASQIELNSRPCVAAEILRADLVRCRHVAAAAAERAGCLLLASGTSILSTERPTVTDDPRFAAMVDKYEFVEDLRSESNACHIHLGKLDRAEAAELSDRIRAWLPVLQALTVNSPFAAGRDTAFASSRYFVQGRWPTVGPPPVFTGEAGYEAAASRLVSSGEILDRQMIYWFARPSEHLPTLEIRVADVNADVDVTMLLVILTRALASTLLAEARNDRPHEPVCDDCLVDSHRQAAIHGLDGTWFDPATRQFGSLAEGLRSLVAKARPALAAAGDAELAQRLLTHLHAHGTGADRQRAAFRVQGSLADVVDHVAALTVAG